MSIDSKKVATIHYKITDEKGIVQDSTEGEHPYSFLGSSDHMFPKVEEKLATMEAGEKATIELEAAEAYGEYIEEGVKITSKSNFPEGVELKEGMTFLTQQDGHDVPVTVKKVEDDNITIDFNHPLAGQKLKMEVELVELRDATEDEMAHGHVHGPGCSH